MSEPFLLSDRAVLKIAGPDARGFLQGIVTQNVEALAPGGAAFSALLTPQGKILFDFILVATAEGFLIDCFAEAAEGLAKRLSLYRLRAKVTIETLPGFAVAASKGPAPAAPAGVTVFADPRLPALGHRLIGPREALSLEPGDGDHQRRRISLGVPEFGRDFASDEVFLTDVDYDALHAVDYKKGCFIGQEVTSRMKRKGEIRKRTVMLRAEGTAPGKGTPVTAGEAALGEVLSGVDGTSLALLRMDRLADAERAGVQIVAGGRAVRVFIPDWLERS